MKQKTGFQTGCMLLAFILCPVLCHAQIPVPDSTEGVHTFPAPVIGFHSDYGLFGGGALQRIDYGNGNRPFLNSTTLHSTVSTRGFLSGRLDYEHIRTFGTGLWSHLTLKGSRLPEATFFGVGNQSEFSRQLYDEGFYNFEEREISLRYRGRIRMHNFEGEGVLDGLLLASVSYANPLGTGEDTRFVTDQPAGMEGGWVSQLGSGLILDKRDNRFNPSRGYRLELNNSHSGRLTGSQYRFDRYMAEFRFYYSPFRNLVVAQKLEVQHRYGDPPFWKLAMLGSEDGLRGFAANRFQGYSSVLYIMELRTWLFSVMDDEIRIGGQIFLDGGRVFTDRDSFPGGAGEIRYTYGFGGVISVFNPDFIIRGDIGISNEMVRIYAGVGYLF